MIDVGDFVSIKEIIIDRKMQECLRKGNNKAAIKWDSYRNASLRYVGIDNDNLAILLDVNNHEIHISLRALEIQ